MKDRVSVKLQEFNTELSELYPRLLKKYPLNLYIRYIRSNRGYYRFSYICPRLKKIFYRIENQYNAHALALYHKLALSAFILDTMERIRTENIPERIKALYNEWFDRAYRDFSTRQDSYYYHKNHDFRKDLAVFSGSAIPVGGAWIAELLRRDTGCRSEVDLSEVENEADNISAWKRFKERARYVLIWLDLHKRLWSIRKRIRGEKLFCGIHTVNRYLPRFTMEEMNKAYLNIAELLMFNTKIHGIYRESWFLDPHLKEISPELSFLWEVPQQNGAELFRPVSPADPVANAIAISPKRKRLYEEGKYKPAIYAYVWPRKELLMWADRQNPLGDQETSE